MSQPLAGPLGQGVELLLVGTGLHQHRNIIFVIYVSVYASLLNSLTFKIVCTNKIEDAVNGGL